MRVFRFTPNPLLRYDTKFAPLSPACQRTHVLENAALVGICVYCLAPPERRVQSALGEGVVQRERRDRVRADMPRPRRVPRVVGGGGRVFLDRRVPPTRASPPHPAKDAPAGWRRAREYARTTRRGQMPKDCSRVVDDK